MRKLLIVVGIVVVAILAWVIFGMTDKANAQSTSSGLDPALQEYVVDDPKTVWGGGDPRGSTYSRVFVPAVINALSAARLTGYKWGGPSQGSLENAIRVTVNPTHVGLCQADICSNLKGQMIPGTQTPFNFTILQENIGDECLYMVTKSPHYKTWGHVIENAWDITIHTGGQNSGSFGTLKGLMEVYPDLKDAETIHTGGSTDIIQAVVAGNDSTFGFFVIRPDPGNAVFELIDDKELTLVPVVDFEIEDFYQFRSLKVARGGVFSSASYHETACTTVQLITGDPAGLRADQKRLAKRLKATIKRGGNMSGADIKQAVLEEIGSWRDYADSFREISGDRLSSLLEASKAALSK